MKAAVIHGPRDIRLETVPDPAIRSDEILVKVMACGICGTDVHTYKRGESLTAERSKIAGHEFSGEVVEVGTDTAGIAVGDKVVGTGYRSCGKCYRCRNGQPERCPVPSIPGEGLDGAFAEYVVVPNPMPGRAIFQIPPNLDWEQAATVEPVSVACHAVRRARIQPGETVVVLGAGMIGQVIVQASRAAGASKVIVSEPSQARRDKAQKLGADVAIDPSERDAIEAVREAAAGEMPAVAFECSGVPAAFYQAPRMIGAYGRIIQVGMFEDKLELSPELINQALTFRNITLRGCGGQRWDLALELMRSGQVQTADLITHEFPLDDVKQAFETQLNADEAIKVLVKP
jgi:2-desacetyl-2-hydroxyethyl bacteriochlorophyllide A dehydrogenase